MNIPAARHFEEMLRKIGSHMIHNHQCKKECGCSMVGFKIICPVSDNDRYCGNICKKLVVSILLTVNNSPDEA